MLLAVSSPAEFVADPDVAEATAETIALIAGVDSTHVDINMTVISGRLLSAEVPALRRLRAGVGTVKVDYVITVVASSPGSTLTTESVSFSLGNVTASEVTTLMQEAVVAKVGVARYTLTVTSITVNTDPDADTDPAESYNTSTTTASTSTIPPLGSEFAESADGASIAVGVIFSIFLLTCIIVGLWMRSAKKLSACLGKKNQVFSPSGNAHCKAPQLWGVPREAGDDALSGEGAAINIVPTTANFGARTSAAGASGQASECSSEEEVFDLIESGIQIMDPGEPVSGASAWQNEEVTSEEAFDLDALVEDAKNAISVASASQNEESISEEAVDLDVLVEDTKNAISGASASQNEESISEEVFDLDALIEDAGEPDSDASEELIPI